jgi:hypothetical protein
MISKAVFMHVELGMQCAQLGANKSFNAVQHILATAKAHPFIHLWKTAPADKYQTLL